MATNADERQSQHDIDIDEITTDVEVEAHIHFGMTGSFPLQIAELFFADDGLYIAEYGYISPFFGLLASKQKREAKAMGAIYDRWGLDAVLVQADYLTWHSYDGLESVEFHSGGRFGRPKITIYPEGDVSHAYRIHDQPKLEEAKPAIDDLGQRHDFQVEHKSGIGLAFRENVNRFFR